MTQNKTYIIQKQNSYGLLSMGKQSNARTVHWKYRYTVYQRGRHVLWLSRGDLKAENRTEIMAVRDQTLQIKYHATEVLKVEQQM